MFRDTAVGSDSMCVGVRERKRERMTGGAGVASWGSC